MEQADIEKIEKIIRERKSANAFMQERSAAYRGFLTMERETYARGSLGVKEKQLIAIGISVVMHCEPCMEHHIHMALLAGASEQEVLEAVEVGIEMGGGPATVSGRFALTVLEYYREKIKTL